MGLKGKTSLGLMAILTLSSIALPAVSAKHRPRATSVVRQANATMNVPHDISRRGLVAYTNRGRIYHNSIVDEQSISTRIPKNFRYWLMSSETNDINRARMKYGLSKLHPNPKLVNLAKVRARQCDQRFSHYNRKHQVMVWKDARNMMISRASRRHIGENISKSGRLVHCQENHRKAIYYFKHPQDLAYTNVYDLMNNDNSDNNQHRDNILNTNYHSFGVGTYYSHKTGALYIVTTFGTFR